MPIIEVIAVCMRFWLGFGYQTRQDIRMFCFNITLFIVAAFLETVLIISAEDRRHFRIVNDGDL